MAWAGTAEGSATTRGDHAQRGRGHRGRSTGVGDVWARWAEGERLPEFMEGVGGRVELSGAGGGRTRIHMVIDWPSEDMTEVSLDRARRLVEGEAGDPAGADGARTPGMGS